MKPKDQWLVAKPRPGRKVLQGYVEVIGKPMKGDTCEVKQEDHVHMITDGELPVKIDGVTYYRTHQTWILAKTNKEYKPISEEDFQYIQYN